ncbi:MAG: acetoacetate decarboxylase family protein, partial [Oscillospiraceae bacterium]|nr:acetoacetate decarboxylase family protein [Oscillospiraceae bacterium]
MSREDAQQILDTFKTQHFTNCRNYVTVCKVNPDWVKEILPPPLEPDEPIVTFALSKGDQFTGLVCGVQCRYQDVVGSFGLAYVMDTELAVRIGRDGLGEHKKQGVTVEFDEGKKYIGPVSRLWQEL